MINTENMIFLPEYITAGRIRKYKIFRTSAVSAMVNGKGLIYVLIKMTAHDKNVGSTIIIYRKFVTISK